MTLPHVFCAAFGVEINSFSPLLTDLSSFEALCYFSPGCAPEDPGAIAAPLINARTSAAKGALRLSEGVVAGAQPGGPLTPQTYAHVKSQLLVDLTQAGDVDIVLLGLHGAMSTLEIQDCEGDLLTDLRSIVGEGCVIAALCDSHGTLSQTMIEKSDILICYKEYPHTDISECADQVLSLALDAHAGRVSPVTAAYDCRMIDIFPTTAEPLKSLVQDMRAAEHGSILNISFFNGFPWANVADNSARILVTADGDAEAAETTARIFAGRIASTKGSAHTDWIDIPKAVDLAANADKALVFGESFDNPGGGAPADSTVLLEALIAAKVKGIAAATLWDPTAVMLASNAGIGAQLEMRIGGKACALSGRPLDLDVEVKAVLAEGWQPFGGSDWPMGPCALVYAAEQDLTIVLTSVRTQCFDISAFTQFGYQPRDAKVLLVKSSQHFRAGFGSLDAQTYIVQAPGVLDHDFSRLPFTNVQRPIWPIDRSSLEPVKL